MVIPIGTRVRIKKSPMLIPRSLAGQEATVTGYEDSPPTVTSLHYLELDGDVTFKYPSLFSWEVEIIK